jgi:hypothetical protein
MKQKLLTLVALSWLCLAAGAVISLTVAPVMFSGCTAIAPGNDPVVVEAERVLSSSLDIVDTFVHLEFNQRTELAALSPDIHTYAEVLRKQFSGWLDSAKAMIRTYKANRSPENKANLQTAIAVLNQAALQAQKYLSAATTHTKPTP